MALTPYALIMAGGRGTRFWPRSRKRTAKQVLRFFGERSLIQETYARLESLVPPERIWVVSNEYLADEIRAQLPALPPQQVIAEPAQRNTTPCIALAAHIIERVTGRADGDQAVLGVFPADHLIHDTPRFQAYVETGFQAALTNDVVVFGVEPRWAETGYGYIEFPKGTKAGTGQVLTVQSFREKPNAERAREFVQAGNFFWNAGMFFWRTSRLNTMLEQHQKQTYALLASLPSWGHTDFFNVLARVYPQCENISIDYGVIEKAENVAGLALDDIGWNDVGSWEAVYDIAGKDASGNASQGELLVEHSRNNYVSASKPVALVGVEDLVVVDTPDALLVAHRSRSQDVSRIVKQLDQQGREELL